MQRRPERHGEEHERAPEARDAPARRTEPADGEEIEERERRDDDRRVDVRLPGIGRVGVREQDRSVFACSERERAARIELAYTGWKPVALPLSYARTTAVV